MQRGYVKLFRKSVDNPLFKKPLVWHYFTYCLMKANHSEKQIIWNKKPMIIERGSFITGRKQASIDTGLTERNIRTAMSILENFGVLFKNVEKSTSKFTYLIVCNYDFYNDWENNSDQQTTSKRPANDQQVTTTKNKQELIRTKKNNKLPCPANEDFETVINFLNSICGTNYKQGTKKTREFIKARFNEGFNVGDFKTVIMKKQKQWVGTSSEEFLRPQTLFGTKFESYLNQAVNNGQPSRFQKPDNLTCDEIVASSELNSGENKIWDITPEITLLNKG